MFVFGWELDSEGLLADGFSSRALTRISRALHESLGEFWHKTLLPSHFTDRAAARYGYQPRTFKHRRRKRREGKRDIPLVYTGTMERLLTQYAQIRAYPSRFSVTMIGPRYVRMRPARPSMPNLGDEATRVDAQDERRMTEHANRVLPGIIDHETRSHRRRNRIR